GSRLLVQESVAARMEAKLRERMENLREGPSLDKSIDIGAIIAPVQLEKITRLVEEGKASGATCFQPSWAAPKEGWYFPPTLFTNVSPAATIAQEEIFGPVVVSLTFRTPAEAVELANDTRYGLAASVWTENVNLALDVAPQLKAGVVWVNSTNLFDAAAGFGGYRESGFGREGRREGMYEYLRPAYERKLPYDDEAELAAPADGATLGAGEAPRGDDPPLNRTAKVYLAGTQRRPDADYSYPVLSPSGERVGEAPLSNRKDVRDAVEAALKSDRWARMTAHARAQVVYYVAENLSLRAPEFEERIRRMTGVSRRQAAREVRTSVERLFTYAAYADKYDGQVHPTPFRNVTLAMNEPYDVLGVVCPDEAPLLAFVSLTFPALAMGTRVVAVPSSRWPLAA